jgi:deoxyribodipyrimidine photo-lyase
LARLAACLPALGSAYAAGRNYAPGDGEAATTSLLSPYLRLRLLTEQEVVAAAIAAHGYGARRFVQEVLWRTYWKGHLQGRPGLYAAYQGAMRAAEALLAATPDLTRRYETAVAGGTGIACFDVWVRALQAEGWLHNHVRMWFASIWIFTLELPWALGAALFERHLLDADAASNTLSWRWVAGLHTAGKPYVARAENIARFTGGRFNPVGLLNEAPAALPPDGEIPVLGGAAGAAWPDGDVALLLHQDDLHPESLVPGPARIGGILVLPPQGPGSARQHAGWAAALADAAARAQAAFDAPVTLLADAGAVAMSGLPVVAAFAPVGAVAAALEAWPVVWVMRDWDRHFWPHCERGYFRFQKFYEKTGFPEVFHPMAFA